MQSIGFLWVCKWSITRSLISKTVEPNELGKALSGIAIVAAAIPSATTPAIRELYKGTIEIFPGSIAILSGSALLIAFETNALLYLNKENLTIQVNKPSFNQQIGKKEDDGFQGDIDHVIQKNVTILNTSRSFLSGTPIEFIKTSL